MATSYQTTNPIYERRSSANSQSHKYIPDNYAYPEPARPRHSNDYLAPPNQLQQTQTRDEQLAYRPVAPEQYQKSSGIPQGVPPAQLPLDDQRSLYAQSVSHHRRPSGSNRRSSVESRHSARSHVSSRSHRSHRSDRPRSEHDRDRRRSYQGTNDHDNDRHADDRQTRDSDDREHQHHKHSSEDTSLKRRNTHRPGYGGTIVAIGSWIKTAWKGV